MNTLAPAVSHRPAALRLRRRGLAIAVLFGAVALSIGACVVAPQEPRFIGEVSLAAPPPAQAEVIGVAPAPGYVWISGYWSWVGTHHVWVAGRWTAPRVGYGWVPHVWVHTGAGWHLREGYRAGR